MAEAVDIDVIRFEYEYDKATIHSEGFKNNLIDFT